MFKIHFFYYFIKIWNFWIFKICKLYSFFEFTSHQKALGLKSRALNRPLHIVCTFQVKRTSTLFTVSCQLITLKTFTDWCSDVSWAGPHVDCSFLCAWSLPFPFGTVAFHLHPIIYEPRIDYAVLYKTMGFMFPTGFVNWQQIYYM